MSTLRPLALALTLGLSLALAPSCGSKTCAPADCPNGCCTAAGTCAQGSACGNAGGGASATGGGAATGGGDAAGGGTGDGDAGTGGGSASGGGAAGGGTGTCAPQAVVPCADKNITTLDFLTAPSTGEVRDESADGGTFVSYIDARGGGVTPSQSYTYARFTPTGLQKVDLNDQVSLSNTTWDIAFRRYIIRLNSGVSGPSCVQAARTGPAATFESTTTVEPNLTFRTEEYFSGDQCDLVPEGSGLGSPATALSSYWTYVNCVQVTTNVYVVKLADGRHVKLQVLSYYEPAAQQTCNATGTAPQPSGSGQFRIRWAFLP